MELAPTPEQSLEVLAYIRSAIDSVIEIDSLKSSKLELCTTPIALESFLNSLTPAEIESVEGYHAVFLGYGLRILRDENNLNILKISKLNE